MNVFDLYASLSLDKSQYDKGLSEAEKSGSSIGSRIGAGFAKVGKAVAVGIGAASTAVGTATVAAGKKLTNLAIDTAAAGDTIDKSSQKLGLSAKAYQEWDYVLSQSGVDIESAGMGFKTLTNQIDSAKKGSKEAQERFAKLGMSMDDINKLSREELFTKAIMGMQGLADNTDRAALANQLFGRSGQELAPLFNSTAESTEALKQKAHELGFVMSDEAVDASVKYTDSLDTLKRTFQGVKNSIVSQLLPGFTSITTGLSELLAGQDGAKEKLQRGAQEIVDSLKKIAPRIVDVLLTVVGSAAEIAPAIIDSLVQGIANNAGKIMTAAAKIIKSFNQSLVKALPQIVKTIVDMIPSILGALTKLIPQFVSAKVNCDALLMKTIGQIIQPLVEKLPDIIVSIVDALMDNLPILIDGINSLVLGIVRAIPQIILGIIKALPTIIEKIITGLIECIPQLIEGLIMLNVELVAHLPEIIIGLIKAIPKVIIAIGEAIVKAGPKLFEAFGEIFGKCWEMLQNAFSGIGEWLGGLFEELKKWAFGVYIKVIAFFQNIWDSITGVFSKIGEFFSDIFSKAVSGIKNAFSGIKQWFSNLWQGIWNVIKTPINWIIDGINAVIGGLNSLKVDIPDWVPFVGGQTWGVNIPKIAKLAKGGFVEGGTPFIAGEAGAEAVIPLENNNQWIYKFAHAFADGLNSFYDGDNLVQSQNKGAGGKIVNINLYLDNVNVKNDDDIEDVANKVSERIAEKLVAEGMVVG